MCMFIPDDQTPNLRKPDFANDLRFHLKKKNGHVTFMSEINEANQKSSESRECHLSSNGAIASEILRLLC